MSWILTLLACTGGAEPLPTAVVAPGDFEVRVSAHGELEARVNTSVAMPAFPSTMTVGWVVESGTQVKAGDPVIEFESTEIQGQLAGALAGLDAERARLIQRDARRAMDEVSARGEIERVAVDLRVARLRVTDSEAVPRLERERARIDVERAELGIAKAQTALETLLVQAASEIELLNMELRRREVKVEILERQLAMTVVTAPTSGLALSELRVGKVCWPGWTLMEIPDLSTMQVVAWVPEVDAPSVHVGQTATVVMDAWPEVPIPGRVVSVADLAVTGAGTSPWSDDEGGEADELTKRVEFAVELSPPAPDLRRAREPVLKPGMTVRVDLLVEDRPSALSVPLQAVQSDPEGTFVRVGGLSGWSRRAVVLGPENALRVVVEDGLQAGEAVALADPEAWAAGQRAAAAP